MKRKIGTKITKQYPEDIGYYRLYPMPTKGELELQNLIEAARREGIIVEMVMHIVSELACNNDAVVCGAVEETRKALAIMKRHNADWVSGLLKLNQLEAESDAD